MKKYVYNNFFVGQVFPSFIGVRDRTIIDTDNVSLNFVMVIKKPTEQEIVQMNGTKEVRLTLLGNAIWFTFKFGTLNWCDAPYSPHLSQTTDFSVVYNDIYRKINIVLIDSTDGKVKYCSTSKFTNDFSNYLLETSLGLMKRPFSKMQYDELLSTVINMYSAKQISQIAVKRCIL